MSRILLVAHDQVCTRMAAPGIRCAAMARELAARGHEVTLAIPNEPDLSIEGVTQTRDDSASVQQLTERCDIVITGGGPLPRPQIAVPPGAAHVVDVSFPIILETLGRHDPPSGAEPRPVETRALRDRMAGQLLGADFLMCASEQQWEFYVGCLTMLGRLTYELVRDDPALQDLLAVVPFGCPPTPPASTGPGARGRIPGISSGDFVLLWSGNISDWYDPETVIRSVSMAATTITNLRLVFLGARPDAGRLRESHRSSQARELAKALGVEGRHVFFHDEWIRHDELANWLLDADAAILAAPRSLESELSVRARFLDYIWTSTPVISTRGGSLAATFERDGLGLIVEPGDVAAMSEAIVKMSDPAIRAGLELRLHESQPRFTWRRAVEQLLNFCDKPRLTPDRRPSRLSVRPPILQRIMSRVRG